MTTSLDTFPAHAAKARVPEAAARLRVAVLGARDSGAAALAAALREVDGITVSEPSRNSPPSADAPERAEDHGSRSSGGIVADVVAPPDLVALAVDAVCAIRPDDLAVAAQLGTQVPVVVVLTGSTHPDFAESVELTNSRLSSVGLGPALVAADTGDFAPTRESIDALAAALPCSARRSTGQHVPTHMSFTRAAADLHTPAAAAGLLDWLHHRRAETITARSSAVRQEAHLARVEVGAEITRVVRGLATTARASLLAARRSAVERELTDLRIRADAASRKLTDRVRAKGRELRRRHLAERDEPTGPSAPTLDLPLTHPPRHRGEEAVLVAMGAAAGTGVGRLVATPLAHRPALLAVVILASLGAGCLLGCASVRTRRTAALRQHLVTIANEQFAALRGDLEQLAATHLLGCEAAITDGFAHDPGPRARELDRRIRRQRSLASALTGSPGARTDGRTNHD